MDICTLTDKAEIQAFLDTDPGYHAYALADLEDPFFSQCQWLAARQNDETKSLVLIFAGLEPPVLKTMGNSAGVKQVLQNANLPAAAMFLGQKAHLPYVTAAYAPRYIDAMLRMTLAPEDFRPAENGSAVRLDASHAKALQALYADEHGNAFAPYQLAQGVFYGIFEDDKIIAAAGTHIVSEQYAIGAVGNVCTRPDHRGRGLAQQVTTAVCQELLSMGSRVSLNVEQSNAPAIHVYRKLGFVEHCQFWEGIGDKIPNLE